MKKILIILFVLSVPFTAFAAYTGTKSAHLVSSSSQYFTAANSASVQVVNGWTVEAWVKMASAVTMQVSRTRSLEKCWGIQLTNTTGSTYVVRAEAGNTVCDGANGTVNINDSAWHFIRVFYNGATSKIYVDGTLDSTVTLNTISNPGTTVFIGATNAPGTFFNGQMALYRIWNNEHTTADQCTIYGTATTNLQSEWSLDNTLTDGSGNANTLTNNNSATFTADVPIPPCTAPSTAVAKIPDILWWGFKSLGL